MKRVIVVFADGSFANIQGDRIEFERDCSMIFAYSGERLVGAFDISTVLKIYISEKSEKNEI